MNFQWIEKCAITKQFHKPGSKSRIIEIFLKKQRKKKGYKWEN